MKKHMVMALMVATLPFLFTGTALALGVPPEVAIGPNGSKAVKLEVGATVGDGSWMWMPFATPINTSAHSIITVSFDIYRDWGVGGHQQLAWGWVNESDQWQYFVNGMKPSFGVEERYGPYRTYPFGFFEYHEYHANTVFDSYANITLEWNIAEGLATATYDGSTILLNTPIENLPDVLYGWDISLNNAYDTGDGAGGDIVWIDNFIVTGSDIYNSYGFENFDLGDLNGQDGWIATKGDGTPIPEPATMLLLGSGLFGLAGFRKKFRKD